MDAIEVAWMEPGTWAVAVTFFVLGLTLARLLSRPPTSSSKQPGNESAPAACPASDDSRGDLKMVLGVRMDLKMGKGKLAAQCCHGALHVFDLIPNNPTWSRWADQWKEEGSAKIVVKVTSEPELVALHRKARQLGVPSIVIADAGRTQIAAGSKTVLAVGPAPTSLVDQVTGNQKLL